MAEKLDEILAEVKATNNDIKQIKAWLYGADGFEGDIPAIKKSLSNHNKRLTRVELIIAGLLGSGALGGGIVGLVKLLGV